MKQQSSEFVAIVPPDLMWQIQQLKQLKENIFSLVCRLATSKLLGSRASWTERRKAMKFDETDDAGSI